MHPSQLEFFNTIHFDAIDDFKKQMESESFAAIAPWILNEKNQSALDLALFLNRDEMVNLFLATLSKKTDRFAYTYALVKAAKCFCEPLADLNDYFKLFQSPESKFTFLNSNRASWGLVAANDLLILKPEIQQLIRSLTAAKMLTDFFRVQQPRNLIDAATQLIDYLNYWMTNPIFKEHSLPLMGWIKPTGSVTMFSRMQKACAYLVTKKEFLLADKIPLEVAENILLLCAKCYPFCTGFLSRSFAQLAFDILTQSENQPSDLFTYFEAITDKQWLRTDNHIPLTDQSLLKSLPQDKIRVLMRAHGHDNTASQLRENKTLLLSVAPGMNILGLYPSASAKKLFELSSPFDAATKDYLHLLLMNNRNLSLKFKGTEIIEQSILAQFPQACSQLNLVIGDASQIPHIGAELSHLLHVHPHVELTLSRKMLLDNVGALELLNCRELLGPNQSIILQVVDTLEHGRILADLEVSHDQYKPGPWITAKLKESEQKDTETEIEVFHDLYKGLPWNHCLQAHSVLQQVQAIESAHRQNKPMLFVFAHQHYEKSLFASLHILKGTPQSTCMIRFENVIGKTACDFILTARGEVRPGPLCTLMACTEPSLYLNSTEHMSRVSTKEKAARGTTQERSSLELTDEDLQKLALFN